MSVHYNFMEHLHVENTENHAEIVSVFYTRLSLLGASMLRDEAYVNRAVITADGETITFKGKMITEAFHRAMEAIGSAQTLDVVMEYDLVWFAMNDAITPDPFVMTECLKEEDEEGLDGMFYSLYNFADCADGGPGGTVAYGNGYHGSVPAKDVAALPDGKWYAPREAVIYDAEDEEVAEVDLDAVEDVCRRMCAFSSYDTFERDENGISFYLNNLELQSDAQLQEFLVLCEELMTLTNNECWLDIALCDLSGIDARTVVVERSDDGKYTVNLLMVKY